MWQFSNPQDHPACKAARTHAEAVTVMPSQGRSLEFEEKDIHHSGGPLSGGGYVGSLLE
ncbi:hypothetical protein MGG_16163 [Pyricularia oryzae 70-15]|uniref:Uncharacterized protein n=3 Tax=Pyricularia oryzae TaxID=318829 RepID=G4MLM5_PYRO7|nr:uncharacterized protein MGG_16163 [Pyricularia oryzae 70-15]EHA56858.1 hypothetical protein MGG_16163 [Pyricularia oryzae 70-15]ELQ38573.1 hypothetical protein OOU_Y34scaffold00534g48 [Pyricularia oryzae Y34]